MVVTFAEEGSLVGVPHVLKQLRVVFDLGQSHGGQRLAPFVVELVPGRYAGVHIEVGGVGLKPFVDKGRVCFGKLEGPVALEPKTLNTGALVEPGGRRGAVGPEYTGRGIVGGSVGVESM